MICIRPIAPLGEVALGPPAAQPLPAMRPPGPDHDRHAAARGSARRRLAHRDADPCPHLPQLRLHQLKLLIKTKPLLFVKHYLKQVSMLLTYKVLVVVVVSLKKMLPTIKLNLLHNH